MKIWCKQISVSVLRQGIESIPYNGYRDKQIINPESLSRPQSGVNVCDIDCDPKFKEHSCDTQKFWIYGRVWPRRIRSRDHDCMR